MSTVNLIQRIYLGWHVGNLVPGTALDIVGAPPWAHEERYEIQARFKSMELVDKALAFMLESVLKDEYQMQLHRETREVPGYALAVAEDGPKLQKASGQCTQLTVRDRPMRPINPPACGMWRPELGLMRIYSGTMANLIQLCAGGLGRPIQDETDLTGTYDILFEVSVQDMGMRGFLVPGGPNNDDLDKSPFPKALAKLGLRLIHSKGMFQTLVIDHLERPVTGKR